MRIGIAGPILVEPFRKHLSLGSSEAIPRGLGGTPVVNLVQGLLARGREVMVFTLDPDVTREVVLRGDLLKLCIGPYRPCHRARDLFGVERSYLRRALLREKPDVIHAHWTYEFALAALETALPTLVTAHDAPLRILRLTPDTYRFMRTLMAWLVARRARNMTAVSGHVARHFRYWLGYRGEMNVVPNAVALETFELGRIRSFRTFGAKVIFGTVLTGWSRVKNGETALQAFAAVRKDLPEAELWMFGPGYGPGESAQRWAIEHNCNTRVTFRGMIPHGELLATLAESVDILVHPSREDASPMAIAEAMTLGIPAIAGNKTGGVPELLGGGECGVLVDAESAREFADAMLHLATNPELHTKLGQLAQSSAQQRFTPSAAATAYESILRILV